MVLTTWGSIRVAVGFPELLSDERSYCIVLALTMTNVYFSVRPVHEAAQLVLCLPLTSPCVLLLHPHNFSNPCFLLPHNLKELGTQKAYSIDVNKYLITDYFVSVILTVVLRK